MTEYLRLTLLAFALAWAACSGSRNAQATKSTPSADSQAAQRAGLATASLTAAAVWYRGVRLLDLTGDDRPDSIVLTALGHRSDSLTIALTFVVDGREAYRRAWTSAWELDPPPDLPDTTATARDHYLREVLDTVLAGVTTDPLDTADIRAVSGLEMLAEHQFASIQVSFAYGYESILTIAWDMRAKEFVELRSCC